MLRLYYSGKLLHAKVQNGAIGDIRLDSADMLLIELDGLRYSWSYYQADMASAVVTVLVSRSTKQVIEVSYELWGD